MSSNGHAGADTGKRHGLDRLVTPGIIVLIAVLYAVSIGGIVATMPGDITYFHGSVLGYKSMTAWACIGMFDTVLLFPAGLLISMRLR
jgi:hypothetical protein